MIIIFSKLSTDQEHFLKNNAKIFNTSAVDTNNKNKGRNNLLCGCGLLVPRTIFIKYYSLFWLMILVKPTVSARPNRRNKG